MSRIATLDSGDGDIALDVLREYTFVHKSKNASLAPDTADIFISSGAAGTADGGLGWGKYILSSGEAVLIGPGVAILRIAPASGSPIYTVSGSSILKNVLA